MLETKTRKIGEIDYQVTQLPAPKGRRLLVRLYKILGPTLGSALKALPEGKGSGLSLGNLETSSIGEALVTLADVISEDELDYFCDVLAETTQFSKEPGRWLPLKADQDFHWSGRYGRMFQWLVFALEVNYSDFLLGQAGLGGFVSAMQKGNGQESDSRKKSTGKPIESPPPSITQ